MVEKSGEIIGSCNIVSERTEFATEHRPQLLCRKVSSGGSGPLASSITSHYHELKASTLVLTAGAITAS